MRHHVPTRPRLHSVVVLALAATGLLAVQAPSVALADGPSDGHASGTLAISQTFGHVGTPQTWTAPSGVTSVVVTARGAQGSPGESPVGMQGSSAVATAGGAGGRGGQVQARIAVTDGEQLTLVVGGAGAVRGGGYNGGGAGGLGAAFGDQTCGIVNSTIYQPCRGGGGGGASDVRLGGTDLDDRVLVAGGGGGGGGGFAGYWTFQPGGNGQADGDASTSTTPGVGGNGAQGAYGNTYPPTYGRGGGGGGGGYLGGNGAAGMDAGAAPSGGGGGSDYVDAALAEPTIARDVNIGNGSVALAYQAPSELQLDLSAPQIRADGTDTVTATVSLTAGGIAMPGQPIVIAADRGVEVGTVTDQGDGTYTASLSGAGLATSVGAGTVTATVGSLVGTRALAVQSGPAAYVVLTSDRGVLAPSDTSGTTLTATVVDAAFHAVAGATVDLTTSADASSTTMTETAPGLYTAHIDAQATDTTYTATTAGMSGSVAIGSQLGAGSADVVRTFASTGDQQTWTVPTGVTSAAVVARGAAGGGLYGQGGFGGQTAAELAVSAGRSLVVMVGGAGGNPEATTSTTSYNMSNGGFNGGGSGCMQFDCMFGPTYYIDGGGGGASDLRLGNDLGSRLLVAGGGGGSARFGGFGGAGGGGPFSTTPGQGDSATYNERRPGGGGGYLGGASSFGSAGGGSSFVLDSGPLAATDTSTQSGTNPGDGRLEISFQQPATLSATSPTGRLRADGTSTVAVTAALVDAAGDPLQGGQVSATVDQGATASAVVDNGDGTYTTTITAGTKRSDLTVTFGTGTLSATATVVQGPSRVALALSSPTVIGDGTSTVNATATFADGDDDGIGAEDVTIDATGGHTTVGPVTDLGDGTYTATLTSTRALGTDTITASNGDLSATASLEVVHGPAASFTFSDQSTGAVVGTPASVTVTVHDDFGHVATSYAGSPGIVDDLEGSPTGCGTKASDGCAHTVSLGSFVDGVATLGFTVYRSTDAGHVTLTDGSVRAVLGPFVVAPQVAHHLAVGSPSAPFTVGTAGAVTITVRDRYDNLAPTQTSDVALTSSDLSAVYPAALTIGAGDRGSKTVAVTLGTTGTQTLTASAPGLVPGTATLAGHLAPAITSSDVVTFRAGDTGQTHVVTTTAGFPGTRTIGLTGDLPQGLSAVVDQTAGTITISGVPSASDAGRWGLTVTASNEAGVAVQHLVITVSGTPPTVPAPVPPAPVVPPAPPVTTAPPALLEPPRFLTAAKAYATSRQAFAFRVAAAGGSRVRLTAGRVPAWLKVTRLDAGRLKLKGTPTKAGTYSVVLTASSPDGVVKQVLKIVVRKKKAESHRDG